MCNENTAGTGCQLVVTAHLIGLRVNLIYPQMLRVLCVFKMHSILNAHRVQTEKAVVVASIPVLGHRKRVFISYFCIERDVCYPLTFCCSSELLFILCSDVNTHLRVSPFTIFLTFFRF
jgi:hypothetical protein